ncbi:MAG TPA: hypothetical protein VM925_23645, partial [Labilithrix sp.]|nr:hypothetical protein [Labilithrix sp.]
MNLVKAPYMRRLLVVVLPVVLVASFIGLSTGCATEDPHEPLLLRIDAPRRRRAPEDPPSQELAAERIEVRGSIATDLEGGAVRREVTLVDAGGQRHDAVTDDLGKFVVRGVSAPYDVTVVPRSGGPSAVFLGVRRADPHLELVERSAPVVPTASQLLRVGVHLGDTPCSTSPGWVTVVTTSASRAGSTLARCRAGEDTIVLDVEHDGQREGAAAEDRVDVHVLVEDEDASSFAYGRLEDVSIADGIIANVGDVAPLPIGMTSPFTIGAHRGTSSLADWQWTTAVFIDVSGDARSPAFLFGMAPTASMRLALPLIPGATMRVSVFGRHPRNDRRGTFFRSTEAWSDVQIPSGTDVELDVG